MSITVWVTECGLRKSKDKQQKKKIFSHIEFLELNSKEGEQRFPLFFCKSGLNKISVKSKRL